MERWGTGVHLRDTTSLPSPVLSTAYRDEDGGSLRIGMDAWHLVHLNPAHAGHSSSFPDSPDRMVFDQLDG